jgi:hypothetical protein
MIDEPFSYIAVGENRQFFAMMTPHMLARCDKELYVVCPSDLVLRTPDERNCLIALFLGKTETVVPLCKRLVLSNKFAPVWIRSPDFKYWIYSFSTPTQVTVQCREAESPPNSGSSYQFTPNGTAILPNSSSCYIHSEAFQLLPYSSGRSEVALNRTHIVPPNVGNILIAWSKICCSLTPRRRSTCMSWRTCWSGPRLGVPHRDSMWAVLLYVAWRATTSAIIDSIMDSWCNRHFNIIIDYYFYLL